MYEQLPMNDGDAMFGVPGTFIIHRTIYVLSEEADEQLLFQLCEHEYEVHENKEGYTARKLHRLAKDELMADLGADPHTDALYYLVDRRYIDGRRHNLSEPDIHETIIRSASARCDLNYYDRETDCMERVPLGRMSAFVRHLVDVDYALWEDFLEQSRFYHAKDFIRGLAAWASQHSDRQARPVRLNAGSGDVVQVGPSLQDTLKIRGYRPTLRFG